jgi:hypothetical protein
MALTRGRFLGYEFDRMVMLFSMVDGQREIPCAIELVPVVCTKIPRR